MERTIDKSKVKVIECWPNKSEYSSGTFRDSRQQLTKMIDGCWVLTSEIEWIEKPIEDKREEKLNQILN